MPRKKFTAEEEGILLDPTAYHVDRSSAIDCMVSDGLRLHEPLIVSLLDDASEYLRASSLQAVVQWNTTAYLQLLRDRLLKDPSDVVRSSAAITAEWVAMTQPIHRDLILRTLAQVVDSDPDNGVSWDAYCCFVLVATDRRKRLDLENDSFDRRRDVDAALIGPYRSAANSKPSAS